MDQAPRFTCGRCSKLPKRVRAAIRLMWADRLEPYLRVRDGFDEGEWPALPAINTKMAPTLSLPAGLLDMLIEEGLISTSTAAKIRIKVQEAWVPIGKFLRQRGHLTMAEMAHLLEIQVSEPHLRLGELAVREGFCAEECIEEALRLQREACPHPAEVLLSEVPCDLEHLCRVLIRYIRLLEARNADLPTSV